MNEQSTIERLNQQEETEDRNYRTLVIGGRLGCGHNVEPDVTCPTCAKSFDLSDRQAAMRLRWDQRY